MSRCTVSRSRRRSHASGCAHRAHGVRYGVECGTSSLRGEVAVWRVLAPSVWSALCGEFLAYYMAASLDVGCQSECDVEVHDLVCPL